MRVRNGECGIPYATWEIVKSIGFINTPETLPEVRMEVCTMQPDNLKQRLGEILAEEEGSQVDWEVVAIMSGILIAELPGPAPAVAQSYLDSVEKRRSDCVFGHAQRTELLRYWRGP